ncbi:hypothetical protein V8D89_002086 [Ganoderma adspersum]
MQGFNITAKHRREHLLGASLQHSAGTSRISHLRNAAAAEGTDDAGQRTWLLDPSHGATTVRHAQKSKHVLLYARATALAGSLVAPLRPEHPEQQNGQLMPFGPNEHPTHLVCVFADVTGQATAFVGGAWETDTDTDGSRDSGPCLQLRTPADAKTPTDPWGRAVSSTPRNRATQHMAGSLVSLWDHHLGRCAAAPHRPYSESVAGRRTGTSPEAHRRGRNTDDKDWLSRPRAVPHPVHSATEPPNKRRDGSAAAQLGTVVAASPGQVLSAHSLHLSHFKLGPLNDRKRTTRRPLSLFAIRMRVPPVCHRRPPGVPLPDNHV